METASSLQEGCPPLEDHMGQDGGHKTDPKHGRKKKSERGTNIHKLPNQLTRNMELKYSFMIRVCICPHIDSFIIGN